MYPAWTQNLKTEEEKEHFKRSLSSARTVLDRLVELLEVKERDIQFSERTQKAYDNPNWAYLQAHRNGYLTAIQSIKNLVLDQESK
jgi:hypothetical protein